MAQPKKPKKAQPKRLGSRPQARTAKALKRKNKPAPHVPYAARPAKAPIEELRPDEIVKTRIPSEFEPARADKIVATLLEGVSRSRVQKALDLGMVKVNGQPADRRTVLNPGDAIEVALPSPGEPTARPVKMTIEVLFEDAHIIAVNKPAGLLTHPVQGSDEVSIVHGLLHYTKGKLAPAGGAPRPGVVHRLDRETSGVIVLAKTDKAYHALVAQFAARTAKKEYLALVDKAPRLLSGVINANIDRHRTVRVRMASVKTAAKPSPTGASKKNTASMPRSSGPSRTPAAPTRFACTSRTSRTRSWATAPTVSSTFRPTPVADGPRDAPRP